MHENDPKITRNIARIFESKPFLMEIAISRLKFVAREDCMSNGTPTMATDGSTNYYHPEVLKTWTPQHLQGVIVHEWLHGALLHTHRFARIPKTEQYRQIFNIAADMVVNPMVTELGFTMPEWGVKTPDKYRLWATEPIYYDLLKNAKESPDGERPTESPTGSDDLREPGDGGPDTSDEDMAGIEAKANAALARLAKGAKEAGCCPAGLEILVDQWLNPKVDWRSVLHALATKIAKNRWSYNRTNASYRRRGFYVPSRYSKEIGDIVMVRDTSGSLVSKQAEVAAEVRSAFEKLKPSRLILMDADCAVHRVLELTIRDSLPPNAMGGGGTDFRPPFDEVKKRNYAPAALVYITDTFGPFPESKPEYPVVWALIDCPKESQVPWGDKIMIED